MLLLRKMGKVRQSNIELLRIIAMFMICMIHANFVSLDKPGIAELQSNTIPTVVRYLIESIGIVGVDIFILISGWFGIRPSVKGTLRFIYQILFFLGGGGILFAITGVTNWSFQGIASVLQLTKADWFIKAYFVLMILSPVLNTFIEKSDDKIQRYVLLFFFLFEFCYGWFLGGRRFFGYGYGPLHMIGIYLLAAYMSRYKGTGNVWIDHNKWIDLIIFLCSVVANTIVALLGIWYGLPLLHVHCVVFAYVNPMVVIGAISLILFFSKLEMHPNKIINWVGASSFAVYLFHSEPTIRQYFFTDTINTIFNSNSGITCLVLIGGFIIVVYVISILLDQVRIISWNWLCELKAFQKMINR